LEEKAAEKNLVIILSTHSSSIIKSAKKLIYLHNKSGDGQIKVNKHCYPAIVLKDIAIEEDIQPDYIFIVEDDMAEMLLKESIKHYSQLEPNRLMPIYKVIPIGGYPQVLDFADNTNNYLFNSKIGIYLFLDFDVAQAKADLSAKANNRNAPEQRLFEQFQRLQAVTKFLPITPELGIWNWLNTDTAVIQQSLSDHYSDVTFELTDLLEATKNNFPNPAESERKSAKSKLKYLVKLLEVRTNENSKRINQFLFGLYVKSYYSTAPNSTLLRQTFGQILSTRGNIIAP
jgi:hypothetical protein